MAPKKTKNQQQQPISSTIIVSPQPPPNQIVTPSCTSKASSSVRNLTVSVRSLSRRSWRSCRITFTQSSVRGHAGWSRINHKTTHLGLSADNLARGRRRHMKDCISCRARRLSIYMSWRGWWRMSRSWLNSNSAHSNHRYTGKWNVNNLYSISISSSTDTQPPLTS